ncbi:hypothetical protein L1049_017879 [Liquidambar formosana]|uniref:FRIGIDA-like protein n=1 Tax=Liquidambar formosana TaxID=63359 RepID=A0AAP0R7J1_LIQFO
MATELINPGRVQTFFNTLETHKTLLTTCTDLYKTISDQFSSLHNSLTEKSQALDSKIQAFNTQTEKTLESLSHRENSIPELESTAAARIEEQKELAVSEIENSAPVNGEFVEAVRLFCRRMDSSGLVRYLVVKRKESMAMRSEIVAAMVEEAVDAMRLVLDGIEEFVGMKAAKVGVADRRWACGVLVQGLFEFGGELVVKGVKGVAASMVERAAGVAERWKGVVDAEEGGGGMGGAEAAMFLQMVAVFGLKEKFEEDFLRKLVMEFATRRDMAKIAVALGFGEKMGDIIDELVKSGKEIEAVYFAYESRLTERFPPVTLLKSYLRNSRRNATNMLKNGNYSATATDEANTLELNSIKAIIKCVEDHKLESQFTIDSLRKRVPLLEKAKADRKKSAASTSRPSNKRGHGGGGRGSGPPPFRPPKAARFSNASPSFGHRNPQSHQAPAARYSAPFNYPNQSMYEGPTTASYGPGYGGTHTQSPVALPQQYSFASQEVGANVGRASGSYGGQPNYGAYDYSAAAPPAYAPSYPQ